MKNETMRRTKPHFLPRALRLLSLGALLATVGCADQDADTDADERPQNTTKGIDAKSKKKESQSPDIVPSPDESLPNEDSSAKGPDEANDAGDCGESNFQAEPLPPNIMLVLDKSGSMFMEKWLDNGVTKSRWASLHATTEFLLDAFGDEVNFGLKLFPSYMGSSTPDELTACHVDPGVEVPCTSGSASDILDKMPDANANFEGATPTVSALMAAREHLESLDDPNPEAAILIVDGRTNCSQSNLVLAAVAAGAKEKGILVYVVGIDLDIQTVLGLAPVATAGGTEKIYNSTDSKALASSLEEIVDGIASCTVPLKEQPPYPELVKVSIDGKKKVPHLKKYTSCQAAALDGNKSGWVYHTAKAPYEEIELCGSSCDAFKKSPKVDIAYECPPPI